MYKDGSSFSGGVCKLCNKKYSGRKRIYCSNKCQTKTINSKGNKNGHWKGGRFTAGGYIYILAKEHPKATKMGYVLEHRLVMEKEIGRYLTDGEIVHHKNHKKNDNRISNLVLMTKREHDCMHLSEYRATRRNIKGKTRQALNDLWEKGKITV